MELQKRALCAFDATRFLHADGIHSFAYGQKDITAAVSDTTPDESAQDLVMSLDEARRRNLYVGGHFRTPIGTGVDPASAVAQAQVTRASVFYALLIVYLFIILRIHFHHFI